MPASFLEPAVRGCGIVAAAGDQGRRFELFHHHDCVPVAIEQQDGDRIPAFEDQPALRGTHGPVDLLVADQELVDFEEIVEKAPLTRNRYPAWHQASR
jgi:hypothetical protein